MRHVERRIHEGGWCDGRPDYRTAGLRLFWKWSKRSYNPNKCFVSLVYEPPFCPCALAHLRHFEADFNIFDGVSLYNI